jgi:hypothetical protein
VAGENYTLPLEETIALVRQFPTPEFLFRRFFPEVGINGQTASWTLYPNTRVRAKYTQFGNASNPIARRPMSHKAAMMAHIRESVYIGAASKYNRRPGTNQTNEPWPVEDQVADELEDLNRRVEYAKEYERAGILFGGIVSLAYADGSYNNVDFLTSTSTHYASVISNWSSSDADIIGDVRSMMHAVRVDSGARPRYLAGGEGMLDNMIRNTVLKDYFERSPYGMRALERGELPQLLGLTLVEYDEGFDLDGTWTPFVPAGLVSCFAEPGAVGMVTLQGEADDLKAKGNPGRFSKAYEDEDPSGSHVIVDDVSLPIIEVPAGVAVMNTEAV